MTQWGKKKLLLQAVSLQQIQLIVWANLNGKLSQTTVILFLVYITNSLCNVGTAHHHTTIFVHLFPFLARVLFSSDFLCSTCAVCVQNPDYSLQPACQHPAPLTAAVAGIGPTEAVHPDSRSVSFQWSFVLNQHFDFEHTDSPFFFFKFQQGSCLFHMCMHSIRSPA